MDKITITVERLLFHDLQDLFIEINNLDGISDKKLALKFILQKCVDELQK